MTAPAGARLTNLVNILKAQRPSAQILVASLLPTEGPGPEDATNAAVRAEINAAAQSLGNASGTDNVYFVDMASVSLVSGDFAADGAGTPHLSASGAQKVAQRWYNVLIGIGNPAMTPTPTPTPTPGGSSIVDVLVNGDFATGALTPWQQIGSSVTVVSQAAHVVANGWFYQTFNTISGATYTVTAKIRVNSVGAGGRIQPLVLDQASGNVLASGTNLTAVTTGYQTQTFTFVATGSQSALHFQTFNSSIDADVDDVTVLGQGTCAIRADSDSDA